MTIAYGGCLEPGGIELDEEYATSPCPRCAQDARIWRVERAESGSLNLSVGLSCSACGFSQGDNPSDEE